VPVYRVLASRTELVLIEAYIRAKSRDDAEDRFWAEELERGNEVLVWDEEYDGSDTDVSAIDLHTVVDAPILEYRQGDPYCLLCGVRAQLVEAIAQPPSGTQEVSSIWIHVRRSALDQGVGL
jgi:hypothetical protein